MQKLNNHICRLMCLILALAGLLSAVTMVLESIALAQAPVTNPSWSSTSSLNTTRYLHTATLLRNGKVLVVGGGGWLCSGTPPLPGSFCYSTVNSSAEIYDPATGMWSYTGSLSRRAVHSATLLANGQVLVAGGANWGYDIGVANSYLKSAEVYDPATGKWRPTGSFNAIQGGNTATLLPSGKVLVTGRKDKDAAYTMMAELYDPATGSWSVTGNPNTDGRTTLLPDGKVLLAGGFDNNFLTSHSAEVYDPATGTWSTASNLITARQSHTATLLTNGKVLVTGGVDGDFDIGTKFHSSAEVFDPGLPQAGTVASVSAASFSLTGLASEAITAGFGAKLATATQEATTIPLPTSLAGTTVKIKDGAGAERLAPLFFVSPTQVNYQIPPGTTAGAATVTITSGDGAVSTGTALIKAVAPSLFAANADGQDVAAAVALRVKADGSRSYEPVAQADPSQSYFVARPLDLGPETDQVYLILFGTGIRQRSSLSAVIATLGGAYAEVSFAGAQGAFTGLDQVNVRVPRSLVGRGEVDVLLTVEAQMANAVRVSIK